MSLSCTDPTAVCQTYIPPVYPADIPVDFTCPAGTWITKLNLAPRGDNTVGTLDNVTCSNGTVLTECAGICPAAFPEQLADCSNTNPAGLAGFQGRAGSRYDYLSPTCFDGTQPISPAGWSVAGTSFPLVQCPASTHRMNAIKASTGCTGGNECVTSLFMSCQPLNQICVGETLNEPFCSAYCSANSGSGVCDAALKAYCSIPANFDKPICGCALPDSQYPILSLRTPENTVPPIACDKRCQSNDAIKLSNTGTCTINTLCVQSNIDITAIQSTVGGGISLNQNCGGTTTPGSSQSGITQFLTSPLGIALIVGLIALIIAIIIIAVVVSNRNRRRKEEERRKQLEQQRSIERQTTVRQVKRPTVVRLQ